MRNYVSRGDDVSTKSETGDVDTGRGRGNTETEQSRHLHRIPGRVVGLPVPVSASAGNTDEVEQNRTHTSNRPQRSTLGVQA